MSTVIVYTRADGGVTCICPWLKSYAPDGTEIFNKNPPWRLPGESEADCEKRTADRLVPAGITYQIISTTSLPKRRFRDAWSLTNSTVSVDMTKARTIRKGEILKQRDELVDSATRKAIKAEDAGDNAEAKKQKDKRKELNGMDLTIDAALLLQLTPDALAAYTPPEFSGI